MMDVTREEAAYIELKEKFADIISEFSNKYSSKNRKNISIQANNILSKVLSDCLNEVSGNDELESNSINIKWISTKDRLPTPHDRIFFTTINSNFLLSTYIGFFQDEKWYGFDNIDKYKKNTEIQISDHIVCWLKVPVQPSISSIL